MYTLLLIIVIPSFIEARLKVEAIATHTVGMHHYYARIINPVFVYKTKRGRVKSYLARPLNILKIRHEACVTHPYR